MALDIFFALILLCSVALGVRSGFLAAVFHTCGWLAAVICGFVFNSEIRGLLADRTHIYESIRENISHKFSDTMTDSLLIPDGFSDILSHAAEPAVTAAAEALYGTVCFALTVAAVMLVLYIFLRIFSKKYTGGLLGFADGLLGGLAGAVRGVVLVLLFSVLLFPALSLMSPELADAAASSLENSHFALYIYENNPFAEILDNMPAMYIGSLFGR